MQAGLRKAIAVASNEVLEPLPAPLSKRSANAHPDGKSYQSEDPSDKAPLKGQVVPHPLLTRFDFGAVISYATAGIMHLGSSIMGYWLRV